MLIGIGNGFADSSAYDSPNLASARCLHGHNDSTVPVPGCGCGYWSVKERDRIPFSDVQGAVRVWGRYIEHRLGYRSERMTLDYLITDSDATRIALRKRYPDVPVYLSWAEADYFATEGASE